MKRSTSRFLPWLILLSASVCWSAGFEAAKTEPVSVGEVEGKGQIQSPLLSPGGEALTFEFLAANGDSLEVYLAEVAEMGVFPPKLKQASSVMGNLKQDVFSLGGPGEKPVSEQAAWGPATKRGTQLVFAATRREASRGGAEVNFDLMYVTKGKRKFLTEHPENDSGPSFSPDGEYLAFTSGRSGEGDIYLYSFYREDAQLTRITFEESGSELYPTYSPDGKSLAFIGHLGGADHLLVIDNPAQLVGVKDEAARQAASRAATRNLTAGWRHSAFAPSWSPDSKMIAFFVHPKGELKSDLYVAPAAGGEPRLLMENVLPGTRFGPAWSPASDGVFVVEENAQALNPIVWAPIDPAREKKRLITGTQLNTDITVCGPAASPWLLYAAQGGGEKDAEKRWRRVFATSLVKAE